MSDLFSDIGTLLGIQPDKTASGTAGMGLTDQSNRYTTDYFAGNQVSIWVGNIWLDDITMIQYNMSQAKRPFYGYKSQKYNTLATGTQIVGGVFSMNYTHTNALNMVLAYYLNMQNGAKSSAGTISLQALQEFVSDAKNNPAMYQNLSYTITAPNGLQPTTNPLNSNYSSALNGLNFNDKKTLLENLFWGTGTGTTQDVLIADNLPDFDVTISFGNYPNERPYGGPDENISSHTVKVLNNVSITGHGIQVSTTGEPVQEVYTFIARGITVPITRNPKPIAKATSNSTGNAQVDTTQNYNI